MSQNTECIVDRGARHKVSRGTIITQLLPHRHWHTHTHVGVFSAARTVHNEISGSARARLRSGVAASSFDTASTMLDGSLIVDARRRSGSSSKFRPQRRLHSNDRRTFLDRVSLPFANALSDFLQTWTAARTDMRVVLPSRSGVQRSRSARTRGVSDQNARASRDQAVLGSRRAP